MNPAYKKLWAVQCTDEEHEHYRKFVQHRNQAKYRQEEWAMEFLPWLALWGDRINERGPRWGQYYMQRRDRTMAWTIENTMLRRWGDSPHSRQPASAVASSDTSK